MAIFRIIRVSPSILPIDYKDKEVLSDAIKKLEKANANMIHFDIMDGKFVPNKSFDEKVVDYCRNLTSLLLDVHLMVNHPEKVVDKYLQAGADILTVHYEAFKDKKVLEETLSKIKAKNVLAGVAISPATPAYKIKDLLRTGLVDVVVVMGVEPGDYGREFIPGSAEKVAEVREMDKNVYIEIDGGVTLKNAKILRHVGANIIVSGSAVFNSKNMRNTIRQLKGNDYGNQIRTFFAKNK